MKLILLCVLECLLMWLICYLNTGSDVKNLRGFRSYPLEMQKRLKADIKLREYIKEKSTTEVFVGNMVVFIIVYLLFGLFVRQDSFLGNFLVILLLGQVLNLFDLIVIDWLWWRTTERIRFSSYPDKKNYQDMAMHVQSFFRGIAMYVIVAVVDGLLLTLL